jgi:hypothetical protein
MSDLNINHQDTHPLEGFSDRKIATLLAALRYFQANLDDIDDLKLDHFEDVDRLSYKEIDELCAAINLD